MLRNKIGTLLALSASLTMGVIGVALAEPRVPIHVPEPSPISILLVGIGLAAYLARAKKKP